MEEMIKESYYAERSYSVNRLNKHYIKALYYYIKWKLIERKIK